MFYKIQYLSFKFERLCLFFIQPKCSYNLLRDLNYLKLSMKFLLSAVLDSSLTSVSTKLDFDEDSVTITNSSTIKDDDVEVKHTIVVSTSLKNNRKGGLHSSNSGMFFPKFEKKIRSWLPHRKRQSHNAK